MGPKYDYDHDERRNHEGYSDPTAFAALQSYDDEAVKRRNMLLHVLWHVAELFGFKVEGRIELYDTVLDRHWK